MDILTISKDGPKKRGRKKIRGEDGRIPIALGEYIEAIVRGIHGKTRPRTHRWIAQTLGMGPDGDAVGLWRRNITRPLLPQALGLHYLFGVPLEAMLTQEERIMLAGAVLEGKRISTEPAPNPRDYSRARRKADSRQVTLEEMIKMKAAAAPPATAATNGAAHAAYPSSPSAATAELDWID